MINQSEEQAKTIEIDDKFQDFGLISTENLQKNLPNLQYSKKESSQNSNKLQTHSSLNYRADIDGLRTIAVGIVVIFHAWPYFMPGGFIGVDIFFVISGYLISGIIIKQTQKNKFSYTDFYSRRIKRIYPALIVVLIFVLVLSAKKLQKRPLQIATQTMAASTVFAANIEILTAEHDYFDPQTTTNPLLHLWSLGVEEQFYIFWPLLLTIVFNKYSKKAFQIMLSYTIISFISSIICVYISTKYSFYLPLCRFWQMSVGGIISYLNLNIENKLINNALSFISVFSIMAAVWIIDENSLFPGFWALIPTLGAACIIQAGKQSFINKYILSSKPFVFLGKISYSLYLWHWPLLVFSRILYPEGSKSIFAKPEVMVLIAVILSIVSYYLVENPFRFRNEKIVPIILFFVIIFIGMTALYINYHSTDFQENILTQLDQQKKIKFIDDWAPIEQDYIIVNGRKIPNSSKNPHRQPPTVEKIKLSLKQKALTAQQRHNLVLLQKKVTQSSKYFKQEAKQVIHHYEVSNQGQQKQLFVIGDSHGRFVLNRLQKLYQQSVEKGKQQEFPTIVSLIREGSAFVSQNPKYNVSMQLIKEHKPDRIFFVYRWTHRWRLKKQSQWVPWKNTAYFQRTLKRFQNDLKQISKMGIKIYLVDIHPQGKQYMPQKMSDESGVIEENIKPVKFSQFRAQISKYFDIFEQFVKNVNGELVNLTDNMCYQDICEVLIPTGYPMTFDEDHQTKLYSRNWLGSVDYLTQF